MLEAYVAECCRNTTQNSKALYYPLFSYLLRIQNKQIYRYLFEFLFIPVYQSFVSSKHQAPSFFEEELAFAIIEHKIEFVMPTLINVEECMQRALQSQRSAGRHVAAMQRPER